MNSAGSELPLYHTYPPNTSTTIPFPPFPHGVSPATSPDPLAGSPTVASTSPPICVSVVNHPLAGPPTRPPTASQVPRCPSRTTRRASRSPSRKRTPLPKIRSLYNPAAEERLMARNEELLKELLIERKARVETEDASRRSAQIEMNNFANEHQDLTNKYNLLNEKFEQQTATIQALLERNTEEQSQIQATIRGLGQVPFDSDATPATAISWSINLAKQSQEETARYRQTIEELSESLRRADELAENRLQTKIEELKQEMETRATPAPEQHNDYDHIEIDEVPSDPETAGQFESRTGSVLAAAGQSRSIPKAPHDDLILEASRRSRRLLQTSRAGSVHGSEAASIQSRARTPQASRAASVPQAPRAASVSQASRAGSVSQASRAGSVPRQTHSRITSGRGRPHLDSVSEASDAIEVERIVSQTGFNGSEDEGSEDIPWYQLSSAGQPRRKRTKKQIKLTSNNIRLASFQLPNTGAPLAITDDSESRRSLRQLHVPPCVAEMLEDPNLDDRTKADIQRSATVVGGYMSHALGGAYKRNLDEAITSRTSRKPRQAAVSASKVKDMITRDAPGICNEMNSHNRDLIYTCLGLDQESDVAACPSVDPREIDAWMDRSINGPGPSLDNLQFDWYGGKRSLWNKRAVRLLAEELMHHTHTTWPHLPNYPLIYFEETVWQKYSNLCSTWKRAQCQRIGLGPDGFENEEEADQRIARKGKVTRKTKRQTTRRHTKYSVRQRICTEVIKLKAKSGDPDKDLHIWKWALEVIERLTADGMSSDESGDEYSGFPRIYRVKIMVWRRHIDELLTLIDGVRHTDTGIFSLRGSAGVPRVRPDYENLDWPKSTREPSRSLPYIFYDPDWFSEVDPEIRETTLHVSQEEFAWLQVWNRQ